MDIIDRTTLVAAVARVAAHLITLRDKLNRLDAAVGDGDLGLTAAKGGQALQAYLATEPAGDDLGRLVGALGMAYNRAAPSTTGALIATALMRAGKEAREMRSLDGAALARMLQAADTGIQERGKAKPGDKTLVDAVHPAAEAFAAAIAAGDSLDQAGARMLDAARAGRDAAIPLRCKIGRASWVGERTEGQPDPGTVLFVEALEAALQAEHTEPGSTLGSAPA